MDDVRIYVNPGAHRLFEKCFDLKEMKEATENHLDWWDNLPKSLIASKERGLKDVEAGRITSHEDVKARYGF